MPAPTLADILGYQKTFEPEYFNKPYSDQQNELKRFSGTEMGTQVPTEETRQKTAAYETSEENILEYLFELIGESQFKGVAPSEDYYNIYGQKTPGAFKVGSLEDAPWPNNPSQIGFEHREEEEGKWAMQEEAASKPRGGGWGSPHWTAQRLSEEYDISDWQNLSAEDEVEEGFWETGHYGENKGIKKMIDDKHRFMMTLQEAFKAAPTAENWGLERKIGDIKSSSERDLESARSSYIPGEIKSRYGTLQGTRGDSRYAGTDETAEAQYLQDIYGIKRKAGRGIQGLQRDYEADWYGGIKNLISNLG